MPTDTTPALSVEHALDLGDDLIRELTKHVGDLEAINAVAHHWIEVIGEDRFLMVCMAALRTTFAECLSVTAITDLPLDAITLTTPEGTTHD